MQQMYNFHDRVKEKFKTYLLHDVSEVSKSLSFRFQMSSETVGKKRCAVLCCLREEDGEVYVLITTRSSNLTAHPGEPCLPGGKEEQGDLSLEDTALREAEEEVGLRRKHVKIVATLPQFLVGLNSYFQCHVVVCTLTVDNADELGLVGNSEVNSIHWVPLRLFLGGGAHHWQEIFVDVDQEKFSSNFFRVVDKTDNQRAVVVWGLTGRICIMIASIVFSHPPTFPITVYQLIIDDNRICLVPFSTLDVRMSSKL